MAEQQNGAPRVSPPRDPVAMRSADVDLPPHPLDKQWFASVDGKSHGPYSGHEIRRMVESGQISASDHLCPLGGNAWFLASQEPVLGGLFRKRVEPPQAPSATLTANGGTVVQVTNHIPAQPNYAALLIEGGIAKAKSPGVALLLSILICGAGQMYNGQVGKGFLMLIGCFFLWAIFLGWIINLWSIIDAYTTAKQMNLRYQRLLVAGMPV